MTEQSEDLFESEKSNVADKETNCLLESLRKNDTRGLNDKQRRKLLQSLHPNKRQLRMWDPELIAMKQRALVSQIYGEQIDAPFWHPNMLRPQRPYWAKLAPSSADFHQTENQIAPNTKKKGQLNLIKLNEGQGQSKNYSYNMRKK